MVSVCGSVYVSAVSVLNAGYRLVTVNAHMNAKNAKNAKTIVRIRGGLVGKIVHVGTAPIMAIVHPMFNALTGASQSSATTMQTMKMMSVAHCTPSGFLVAMTGRV